MPEMNGVEAARRILADNPQIQIVSISMRAEKPYVREAMRALGKAYLLKRSAADEIGTAIRTVMIGKVYVTPLLSEAPELSEKSWRRIILRLNLTPRQREILQSVAEGHSAKIIAHKLGISIKTAEFHKQVLMREPGLQTAIELTKYTIEHGLASTEREFA